MLALDRLTGTPQWSFQATNPIFAGPLVYKGLLYITSVDGILHVVDASTGSLVLQVDLGGATFASPAVNNEVILASTGENKLVVLDRKTGAQRFAFDLKSPSASTPSILDGKAIVPSQNTALWAVDWMEQQGTWEERWYRLRMQMWIMGIIDSIESRTGFIWLSRMTTGRDSVLGSPAVSQGRAFYCTIRGKCASVDTSTGEQIWQTDLDEQIFSSPVLAGEALYFGTNKGTVYALDRTSGQLVWEFQADGKVTADIVPANGMFYIASQGGTLYALSGQE
jgi:outer membrane protein assembly factor BamB